VIFINDGAPAHRNPENPGPNTEPKKLPPYSPFLNIVEQAISCLKAGIKADISRPEVQVRMDDREEARDRGLALGNFHTQLLLQALQCYIGTITAAKCDSWHRFIQTYFLRYINGEEIEGLKATSQNCKITFFENRFFLNACDKHAIVCKIALFFVKFSRVNRCMETLLTIILCNKNVIEYIDLLFNCIQ